MVSNQKKRILVIEDDEDMKTVMVAYLKRAGYETIAASDGKDGLKSAGGGRWFRGRLWWQSYRNCDWRRFPSRWQPDNRGNRVRRSDGQSAA